MLTDIGPTAGSQFYGSQIPGMNIANISSHIQKPGAAMAMVVSEDFLYRLEPLLGFAYFVRDCPY